jgi:hypothetical protein
MSPRVNRRRWALTPRGIYSATIETRARTQDFRIQFFDLESGEVTELFRRQGPFGHGWSLAVSPDETSVLYDESPVGRSELMLMEDFS